jgi:hypothetical protein
MGIASLKSQTSFRDRSAYQTLTAACFSLTMELFHLGLTSRTSNTLRLPRFSKADALSNRQG